MKKKLATWIAIAITCLFSSFWAFWGIIENFHEGWYYESTLMNIGLMLFQYLIFSLLFLVIGIIAIKWKKIGAVMFILTGILIPILGIRSNAAIFVFSIPLIITGVLFWFGELKNKKWAYIVIIGLPLLTLIISGIEPIIRVSQRIDDNNYEARIVEGNNVKLIWAPEGYGWATTSEQMNDKSWKEVSDLVAHLNEDGKTLSDTVVNVWRLPTVPEAVASLTRNATNCGGKWDEQTGKASYNIMPDKETPLWKIHSPIVYWWTSTEVNDSIAYRVVYNGGVQKQKKKIKMGSLGYRAVKETK
ncbi:MAG: O-antigen ligase [Bacteroidetes bacterium]|nr:O-antigen ligase [Bacteroidota bacterium]